MRKGQKARASRSCRSPVLGTPVAPGLLRNRENSWYMVEAASVGEHECRKLKELNTDMKQTEEPGWFQDVSSTEDHVKHGDLDFQLTDPL